MDPQALVQQSSELATDARLLAESAKQLADSMMAFGQQLATANTHGFFITGLTVFVLAVFVGYYVVWRVTPALHSPLMSVTNAISSVIIVGALIAAGPIGLGFAKIMGFVAVTLAAVNIFGGFIVTPRMPQMFQRKK